jgi:hypothetical protein
MNQLNCNWGDEIPAYMDEIKVLVQAMQRVIPQYREGIVESVKENTEDQVEGVQGAAERADGEDADGVQGTIKEVVKGGTEGTPDDSIEEGAKSPSQIIPVSDDSLRIYTREAIVTALDVRRSLRVSVIQSVGAQLERLRQSG